MESLKGWIKHHFLIEKMDTIVGWVLMASLAILVAMLVGQLGVTGPIALLSIGVSILLVIIILHNIYLGLFVLLIMSILISWFAKIVNLPFGLSLDILLGLMALGVIGRQITERDSSFARSPMTFPILVWVFYNLIQVINPIAASQLAWAYTVRSMAVLILLYFIACYALNSYERIIRILKFMVGLAFISALYGLKQEFFGFFQFELDWLYAEQGRFQLIFQWARLRIFSFFSDPTNYGIYMSYMAVISFILMLGPISIWKKVILAIAGISMVMAIGFAGSRTPVVLLPFGLGVFALLSMNKKVLISVAIMSVIGAAFMFKSTNSAVLYRIQSAFFLNRSGDTIDVRNKNQELIKPFIQSHPFGGGLGSVGEWGQRFSPGTFLAKFPPDSGFVRVAVELGWIGYLIYCWLIYTIIKTGIYYYFRVKNNQIKIIYLAITIMMFMLLLASYVQEAIVQLPTSIYFYICLAIIARLKDFDD